MNLLLWVLRLLDGVMGVFRQLAGLDTVDGADLISLFLENVIHIFFGIVLISVVVTAITIIVAVVKATVNMGGGEPKPMGKIVKQGVSTIFVTLLMAIIMLSGIQIGNSLLRDVNAAFGVEKQSDICNDLFEIGVGDDAYEMVEIYEYEQKYDIEAGMFVDDYDKPVYLTDAEGNVMKDDNGNPIRKIKGYKREPVYQKDPNTNDYILDANGNKIPVEGGWTKTGKDIKSNDDWSILNENADTILGQYAKDFPYVFPNPNKVSQEGLIYFGSFNFILGYVAAIIVLVSVISACLGLVKRLYDLVILFLSLPLISATIPLDDGARFKVWRETVVSKIVLAYGAVFAVNVFMTMVPLITSLHITKIMKMLLVVGGGLSISGGMLLFARILGTDAAESREMAQSARTLLAGGKAATLGVAGVAMKAGKITGGGLKGIGAVGGFLGNRLGLGDMFDAGTSQVPSKVASGVMSGLTTQAATGSRISNILENAGIEKSNMFRDKSTGRILSKQYVGDLIDKGLADKEK